MKHPIFLLGLILAPLAFALSPDEQLAKLRSIPITVYPDAELMGSPIVTIFNSFARSDDALVVSSIDAMKDGFRVSNLGVNQGGVWLVTRTPLDLTQRWRRQTAGVTGVVYIPDTASKRTRPDMRRDAVSLREEAHGLGVPLVVGLEQQDARSFRQLDDVVRSGDILTIYASNILRAGSGSAYRQYVERLVAAARETNPKIRVEIAVPVAATSTATAAVQAVLVNIADLADRVAIYCDDRPESLASLKQLAHSLRG